jgi:UbiD family decarboxylase
MPTQPSRTYADLNEHLQTLQARSLLYIIDQPVNKDTEMHPLVRWQFRGGIAEKERKGFWFRSPTDSKGRKYANFSVGIGVLSSNPAIYALGMNCQVEEIGPKWLHALNNPVAPVEVQSAPVQEVVLTGEAITQPGTGLEQLAVPISTPGFDVAPYFTAGLWITKDPETGVQNMGIYRGMLKGPNKVGCMMERSTLAGGDLHWQKYRALKQPMPFAVVLGAPPIIEYVGPQKLPIGVDELTIAGALAGGPIRVVKAKTVDLLVPAEAQVIVEGLIDTQYLEPEGPFGESHGYMQIEEYNFIGTVTAITRRPHAIITSIISQVTPSESSVIKKVAYEPLYLDHLRHSLNIKSVQRVSLHEPLTNLRKFVFVVMERSADKTEVWRALMGVSAYQPAIGKFCIAINEDIDPENTDQVLWALAYRCNPAADVQIVDYRSQGHAPHTAGPVIESTLLADATLKCDFPPVALPSREYMEQAQQLWKKLGLPALKPEVPWYGYSLGEWNDEWAAAAQRAAAGDWPINGRRAAHFRKQSAETQVAAADILGNPWQEN